jgi:hypothetical protein
MSIILGLFWLIILILSIYLPIDFFNNHGPKRLLINIKEHFVFKKLYFFIPLTIYNIIDLILTIVFIILSLQTPDFGPRTPIPFFIFIIIHANTNIFTFLLLSFLKLFVNIRMLSSYNKFDYNFMLIFFTLQLFSLRIHDFALMFNLSYGFSNFNILMNDNIIFNFSVNPFAILFFILILLNQKKARIFHNNYYLNNDLINNAIDKESY